MVKWLPPAPILSPDGKTLVALGLSHVQALDAESGEERWCVARRDESCGVPAFSPGGGTVYLTLAADLLALDMADGSERWRATVGRMEGSNASPFVTPDGAFVVLGVGRAEVKGVSTEDHRVRATHRVPTGQILVASLAFDASTRRHYGVDKTGNVVALELTDESPCERPPRSAAE